MVEAMVIAKDLVIMYDLDRYIPISDGQDDWEAIEGRVDGYNEGAMLVEKQRRHS